MKTLLPFSHWLVLAAAVCLRAQLPPPTAPGTVNIEVSVGGDTRFVQHDYQPPKPYTILAQTVIRSLDAVSTSVLVPGAAGSVVSIFTFDENYSANHPEIRKRIRGVGLYFESVAYYRNATERTDWDEQGRPTFSVRGFTGRTGSLLAIEGRGRGQLFQSGTGPSAYPIPRFHVADVVRTEGKVPWFSLGRLGIGGTSYPLDYRYLTGAGNFWTETQPDGTVAVFHSAFYRLVGDELGEFYPIGSVATTGTAGQPPHFEVQKEPVTPEAALQKLKAADWSFTGEFVPTSPASAIYISGSNGATASKLQYKLQVQPGLARTITWSETFTPEGATEPTDYRFVSEEVAATASETRVHLLDPFQWLEGRSGRYEVVAFESESFDATLTADTNRDGTLVSAGGPITPYVIAHADTVSTEQPYVLAVNADDDDADGVLDRADAVVNGADDLADFVPVFLNIKQLLATLPPSANARYKLKQTDGALNFVYTDLVQAAAFDYLNNPGGGFGPAFDHPAAVAPVEAIMPDGVELSADFLNRIKTLGQGVILIEATRPTQQPLVLSVETATGTAIVRLPLLAYEASIAVDANRDGEIKADGSDVTTAERPFRFWSNDDDDAFVHYTWASTADNLLPPGYLAPGVLVPEITYEDEEDDKNVTDASQEDWRDNIIDTPRDLEDFARIHLYVGGLQEAFKNGQLFLGLKWTDTNGTNPAIKLYRATEGGGTSSYLFSTAAASQQSLEAAIVDARYPGYSGGNFQSDHTLIGGSDVFVIPTIQFSGLSVTASTVPFLFEGCTTGKGQLTLVILKKEGTTYTEIGDGPGVWLELRKPNEFVERFSCGDDHLGEVVPVHRHASSATFAAPTKDEEKDYLLYVHGYNMADFEKQRWIETAYKRLYWLGYKGRVGGFSWPCSQSAPPFDRSEEKAWQSAAHLKAHLENLKTQGYRVHVIAHSQGNVVMGEALREAGSGSALVRTYIASQAAVAASCYKENVPLMPDPGQETPDVYGTYPPTSLPYFDGSVMSDAASRYVNFYNPTDYALTGASGNGFSWEADQRLKPNQGWGYNVVDGFFESNTLGGLTSRTFPNDRFRIFSFGAEAKSRALGTMPTGGVFTSFTNLHDLDYDDEHIYHSAQFRAAMATRYPYWDRVLRELGLPSLAP